MGPCHLAIWAAPPIHHWAYFCLQGLHHLGDDDTSSGADSFRIFVILGLMSCGTLRLLTLHEDSRDRSLMHPCYVLIHADDYWAFNQRPHGLIELVLGDRDLSFPCVLPQMINFPILQTFLAPLVPEALACISLNRHNGAALDFRLVSCFDGFFVQVAVSCGRAIMDNIIMAAPIVMPQIHIDTLVLPDPQLLQVTAFVPGGDTLISSRSVTVVQRRDRVFAVLDTVLRQRFPDMLHVGFEILTVHPSAKWPDATFSPHKEKGVTVYSDEFLRRAAAVLLRLSLPPHDEELSMSRAGCG